MEGKWEVGVKGKGEGVLGGGISGCQVEKEGKGMVE